MVTQQIAILQRVCHQFLIQGTESSSGCFPGQVHQAIYMHDSI